MSEGVGTFQAFYSIIFPANTTITNPFFMRVATLNGTAGEKCILYVHAANYYKHYALVYNTFMYIQMRMTTNSYVVVSRNDASLVL